MSTWLGAIGILVYQQSFFSSSLHGAVQHGLAGFRRSHRRTSVNKASIVNVIVGTFLFQGIVTMTPSVMN